MQGGYFGDAVTGTTYTDSNAQRQRDPRDGRREPVLPRARERHHFSQDLGTFTVSAPVSGSLPQQAWGTPIPSAPFGPASGNIRIRWQFSLTAGDSVATKGFFQVEQAPEPATVVLLGLGLAAIAVSPPPRLAPPFRAVSEHGLCQPFRCDGPGFSLVCHEKDPRSRKGLW